MDRATLYEVIKAFLMETSMLSASLHESAKGNPQKLKRAVEFMTNDAVDKTKTIIDFMDDYKDDEKMWRAKANY